MTAIITYFHALQCRARDTCVSYEYFIKLAGQQLTSDKTKTRRWVYRPAPKPADSAIASNSLA